MSLRAFYVSAQLGASAGPRSPSPPLHRLGLLVLSGLLWSSPGAHAQEAPTPSSSPIAACAEDADRRNCIIQLLSEDFYQPQSGTISPDGRRFAYMRSAADGRHVWIYDRTSESASQLTSVPGHRQAPSWSPDGTRLAFEAEIPDAFGEMTDGIGVVDVRSGEERLIYRGETAPARSPTWTPDGRIVFRHSPLLIGPTTLSHGSSDGSGRRSFELRIMDPDGASVETFAVLENRPGPVAFSFDGERTAWVAGGCEVGDTTGVGLWTAAAAGRDARCVLPLVEASPHVAWAPDGESVYFVGATEQDGAPALQLLSLASGEARRLTEPDGHVTSVGVTRRGEIALSVFRPSARLATVSTEGGVPEPIPMPDSFFAFWPTWRPDGSGLAFTATPGGAERLWPEARLARLDLNAELAADGSPVPWRSPDSLRVLTGRWSPDGRLFASYGRNERRVSSGFYLHAGDQLDSALARLSYADYGLSGAPTWSPEGRRIVFAPGATSTRLSTSERLPRNGLNAVDVDSALLEGAVWSDQSREAVTLEGFEGVARFPAYGPDGRRIAFTSSSRGGGHTRVFTVPADGGVVDTVATFRGDDLLSGPEWSPDGRSLFFASPGADGTYRIRRVSARGGLVETVTDGAAHALHPRVSPDGRTLVVTLWNAPTELRILPSETPGARLPAVDPATLARSAPVRRSEIRRGLVSVVLQAERELPELPRLWPGFWDSSRTYAVRTPDEPFEALIVTPGPRPAGFRPVAAEDLPIGLQGRLYHGRGIPARFDAITSPIPIVEIEKHRVSTRKELEERLFRIYRAAFPELPPADPMLAPDDSTGWSPHGTCPDSSERSCLALIVMEHRMLFDALSPDGPNAQSRLLRAYAAARWLRLLNRRRGDQELALERRRGVSAYIARRAAMLAVGADLDFHRRRIFEDLRTAYPMQLERNEEPDPLTTSGQAILWMLDHTWADWQLAVREGATLLEILFDRFELTKAEALPAAVEAMEEQGFSLLRRFVPGEDEDRGDAADARRIPTFFLRGLQILRPSVTPVDVSLRSTLPLDTGTFHLEYRPGPAGRAVPWDGFVLLPDPEHLELRTSDVHLVVRDHPVAIQRDGNLTIRIIPEREITDELDALGERLEEKPGRLDADGIDLWLAAGSRVVNTGGAKRVLPPRPRDGRHMTVVRYMGTCGVGLPLPHPYACYDVVEHGRPDEMELEKPPP